MKEKIRSTRLRMCFRKMPPAVCFLTLFALCFGALSVRAADPSGRVALTAVRMQRAGGQVYVSFAVKIAPRAVRARHRWVITPCLGNASDSVLLGPFVVTGRIMAREENQRGCRRPEPCRHRSRPVPWQCPQRCHPAAGR